jgi:hypothetical protein
MLTVRRYLNLADAGLAKTLLENYEIFGRLFDENAHIYLGPYIAVPVRLVVGEAHFDRASRILGYVEKIGSAAAESDFSDDRQPVRTLDEKIFGVNDEQQPIEQPPLVDNPWEILAVAYLFFVPGAGFILEKRTLMLLVWRNPWRHTNRFLALSPFDLHLLGIFLIGVAFVLIALYWYTRSRTPHEEASSPV